MAPDRPGIHNALTSAAAKDRLTAAALAAVALGVLISPQANPEPRLIFFDIPINSAPFLFAAVAFASGNVGSSIRRAVFIAAMPVLLTVAATLWSRDIEIGLIKSANLYLSATLAAALLGASCVMVGVRQTLRVLLALLSLLLLFALIAKVRNGFFDRTVPYGLNGPIVFGRFMGVAAVISVFVLTGKLRAFAVFIFLVAVAWTESKGPALAVVAVLTLISLIEGKGLRRFLAPGLIVGLVVAVAGVAELAHEPIVERFMLAASFADPDKSSANYGSIGSRVESYTATLKLIEDAPLGVGTGGWVSATGLYIMEYPHNFALEMASELGLLLAPIAILPFLAFLLSPIREFRYLALLLALAQQTSGDLLDSRMWLAISLASVAVPRVLPAVLPRRGNAA